MSKISVVIPVYRAELYIHRCLESILNQTFWDFDVILIDDGSPDMCPNICDEYSKIDKRVFVIHQKNSGPSNARNNGIEWAIKHSDSKYLTFVDCDDVLHPQFMEYMYHTIENLKADVAMCRHEYIRNAFTEREIVQYKENISTLITAEELMIQESSSFNYIWGKLYNKECFQELRFPNEVSFGEDNLIIFRVLFKSTRLCFIKNSLYYYIYTPTSITKSPWSPNSLKVFDGIKMQLDYYRRSGFEKAYKKEMELYIQQYAYQIHRIRENRKDFSKNKKYLIALKKEMKILFNSQSYYKIKDNFYWYEAMYPHRAFIKDFLGKIKRRFL